MASSQNGAKSSSVMQECCIITSFPSILSVKRDVVMLEGSATFVNLGMKSLAVEALIEEYGSCA
jgi:hypothetical protein